MIGITLMLGLIACINIMGFLFLQKELQAILKVLRINVSTDMVRRAEEIEATLARCIQEIDKILGPEPQLGEAISKTAKTTPTVQWAGPGKEAREVKLKPAEVMDLEEYRASCDEYIEKCEQNAEKMNEYQEDLNKYPAPQEKLQIAFTKCPACQQKRSPHKFTQCPYCNRVRCREGCMGQWEKPEGTDPICKYCFNDMYEGDPVELPMISCWNCEQDIDPYGPNRCPVCTRYYCQVCFDEDKGVCYRCKRGEH